MHRWCRHIGVREATPVLLPCPQGAYFYRIIDQFIDQTGVETESVFGGQVSLGAAGSVQVCRLAEC